MEGASGGDSKHAHKKNKMNEWTNGRCTHYLVGVRSLERQCMRNINRLGETKQKQKKKKETKTMENKHKTNGMIKWVNGLN